MTLAEVRSAVPRGWLITISVRALVTVVCTNLVYGGSTECGTAGNNSRTKNALGTERGELAEDLFCTES